MSDTSVGGIVERHDCLAGRYHGCSSRGTLPAVVAAVVPSRVEGGDHCRARNSEALNLLSAVEAAHENGQSGRAMVRCFRWRWRRQYDEAE